MRAQNVGHVVLKARNLQTSGAFYADVLGMRGRLTPL
jgi:catechol 2,3-dioxygenase-like lactoylglutathione lyase family enzyme